MRAVVTKALETGGRGGGCTDEDVEVQSGVMRMDRIKNE